MGIFKGVLSAVQSAEDRQLRKQQMEDAKIRAHAQMLHQQGIEAALQEHRKAQESHWDALEKQASINSDRMSEHRKATMDLAHAKLANLMQTGKTNQALKLFNTVYGQGGTEQDWETLGKRILGGEFDSEPNKSSKDWHSQLPPSLTGTPSPQQAVQPALAPPPAIPTPPSVFMQRGEPVQQSDLGAMPLMNLPETPPVEPVGFVPGQAPTENLAPVMQAPPNPALNPFNRPSPKAQREANREERLSKSADQRIKESEARITQMGLNAERIKATISNMRSEIAHRGWNEKFQQGVQAALEKHRTLQDTISKINSDTAKASMLTGKARLEFDQQKRADELKALGGMKSVWTTLAPQIDRTHDYFEKQLKAIKDEAGKANRDIFLSDAERAKQLADLKAQDQAIRDMPEFKDTEEAWAQKNQAFRDVLNGMGRKTGKDGKPEFGETPSGGVGGSSGVFTPSQLRTLNASQSRKFGKKKPALSGQGWSLTPR